VTTTGGSSAPGSGQVATTFGWDTVFAIRMRDVNTAIRKALPPPYPARFSQPFRSNTLGTIPFRGTFGMWQMCAGGSGELVRFAVPLKSVEFDAPDESGKASTTALGPARAVIEVRLSFLPHDVPTAALPSGSLHKLVVAASTRDPGQAPVTLVSLEFEKDPGDETVTAAARSMLTDWFVGNLEAFTHVFSLVNLDRKADQGQFEWLLPTFTSYAFASNPSCADDSVLAILCMTQNRSADGLIAEVSEYAIPDGARSGFLLSRPRFLEEVVLPAIPHLFQGARPEDFTLSDARDEIRLAGSVLPVQAVKGDDGKQYPAELHDFHFSVDGECITIEATTKVTICHGVHAICSSRSRYRLVLINRAGGTQTLDYVRDGEPVTHYDASEDTDITLWKGVIGLIGVVVGIAIAVLTDGAGAMIGLMVATLLIGLAQRAPDIVAAIGQSDAPSIDLLVLNTTDPVRWSDSKDFRLSWVGLNDSLQMGGDPGFAH
jgi:hypothetical protein